MMRKTPRTFVGSAVFRLDGPVSDRFGETVRLEVERLPGVSRCQLDVDTGTLMVTAATPVDRTDVVEVLDRLDCPVCG